MISCKVQHMWHISAGFFFREVVRTQNDTKLIKNTIWKLLNEIFEPDKNVNEEKMKMFSQENDIKLTT